MRFSCRSSSSPRQTLDAPDRRHRLLDAVHRRHASVLAFTSLAMIPALLFYEERRDHRQRGERQHARRVGGVLRREVRDADRERPAVRLGEDDERQEERIPARDDVRAATVPSRGARAAGTPTSRPGAAGPVQDGRLLELARNRREEGRRITIESGSVNAACGNATPSGELSSSSCRTRRRGAGSPRRWKEQPEREEGVHGLPAPEREPCDHEGGERRGGQDEERRQDRDQRAVRELPPEGSRTGGRSRSSP